MVRRLLVVLVALAVSAAAPPPRPSVVALPSVPRLELAIDPAFRALPLLAFPIENLTNAERRIFVEVDAAQTVRRMIVVQFETVRPGAEFRFRFPARPPRPFGAQTYRFGAYVHDDAALAARQPDKEAARTRAHLWAHGLSPARAYRVARLARVADPQGLSEVIILYMENADGEVPPGPLAGADEDGDVPIDGAAQAALVSRMDMAIRVISG